MFKQEKINYAYTPREVAERFLTRAIPQEYTPRTGSRETSPPNSANMSPNVIWHHMHDERITEGDKVRYLAERPIVDVALIVADMETGLTPEQERFALYTSAAYLKFKTEIEIMRYEMEGEWFFGRGYLRHYGRDIRTDADYLEVIRVELEQMKRLQQELMEVSSPPSDRER